MISHCKRRKIRLITTGAAGGKTDPARIRLGDLSRSQQDPLLSKTRSLLRQQYAFPRNLKKSFGVACIWSDQQLRQPLATDNNCATQPSGASSGSLNCGGFGSSMAVTASFGLFAAAHVLEKLALSNNPVTD